MRTAVWSVLGLAALNACAPQQNRRNAPQSTSELTMSGALEQTVMHARLNGGYAATVAGGRYSMGMEWPKSIQSSSACPCPWATGVPSSFSRRIPNQLVVRTLYWEPWSVAAGRYLR